jgi:putative DNA primase/helicase
MNKLSDWNDLHCLEGLEVVRNQIAGIQPEVSRVIPLGYYEDTFYYITSSNRQIIPVLSASHVETKFLSMMPMRYWESQYPGKIGPDYKKATGELMDACRSAGVFKPRRIRGGGVWFEEKHGVVVNLGKSLYVGGKNAELNSFKSKYTYTIAPDNEIHENPLTVDECAPLITILDSLRWKKPEFSKFLAGWLIAAPLCGMLPWRPHVWLLGPPGSGKSWIMEHLVAILFGENKTYVQGSTSEAGIRQSIGSDAMPVIFDEFETDDQKSSDRVRSILELIRQASSESEGSVVKGSAGGKSIQFQVRFSAMVASVRLNLEREQDRTRFTILELLRPDGDETKQFRELQEAIAKLPPDFGARLFSRSVRMAQVILANQKLFHVALSERYNARFGQQYGTLLAGYASLISDFVLGPEEIDGIIDSIDLSEESEIINERDEGDCLEFVMQKIIKGVDLFQGGKVDRSVRELVMMAMEKSEERNTLSRYGFKFIEKDQVLFVANKHPELSALFAGTKWLSGWRKALGGIDGAKPSKDPIWMNGMPTRGILIPIDKVAHSPWKTKNPYKA